MIIDRIEGDLAVIELPDRSTKDISLNSFPNHTRPGDCFWLRDEEYIPAPEETAKRKIRIDELSKSLWND